MADKKKRRPSNIPKDEKPEARFVRVATPRVNKVVKALKNLAHCSGSTYKYTAEQVRDMFAVINTELDNTIQRFSRTKAETESFSFKS